MDEKMPDKGRSPRFLKNYRSYKHTIKEYIDTFPRAKETKRNYVDLVSEDTKDVK